MDRLVLTLTSLKNSVRENEDPASCAGTVVPTIAGLLSVIPGPVKKGIRSLNDFGCHDLMGLYVCFQLVGLENSEVYSNHISR